MCSASSIARRIEATVASMLTTTPLRSPFDGCVPMPMMSMPSSVTSPTMAQIFVVPMSRPTRMSPLFAMFHLRTSPRAARRPLAPSRARPTTTNACDFPREPHGHPIRAPAVLEVQHLGAPVDPAVPADAGDHRQVEPVARARTLEVLARGVHEVERAEVHDRGGAALDDPDRERGRQRAAHLGRCDPGVAAERVLDERRVHEEEVVAALHRGELEELLCGRARDPLEPDLADSEEVAAARVHPEEPAGAREEERRRER